MKKRQNSFKVSNTIGFSPFFIVFVFFYIFFVVYPVMCVMLLFVQACACCVVGQNPSQTSTWCPMVTGQLANMTGDTNFLFFLFF